MTTQRKVAHLATVFVVMLNGACSGEESIRKNKSSKYSLTITGYNYTDHYIDSFSVNGAGGGNIFVSSPTSGGGGSVCCGSYYPKLKNQTVRVRWQSGGCKYFAGRGADGSDIWLIHPSFKEADALVVDVANGEPQNMEVHIYPDDKVQVQVSSEVSLPRMKLEKGREIDGDFPRCPHDKEPK
jgi:hypothetical protein